MTEFVAVIQAVSLFIGVLIALCGIGQYNKQNLQKYAEMFFAWRREIDKEFPDILGLLDSVDPEKAGVELRKIPFQRREAFVAFHEEIALACKSGLLKKAVALYIFGQYAILCWDNPYFWEDLNRDEWYWKLFKEFVADMRVLREKAETQWPSFSKELQFNHVSWMRCKSRCS